MSRFWAELWKTYSSTGKRRDGHLALLVLGPSDSHILAILGPFGPSSGRAFCPRALPALGPVAALRVATLLRALASALMGNCGLVSQIGLNVCPLPKFVAEDSSQIIFEISSDPLPLILMSPTSTWHSITSSQQCRCQVLGVGPGAEYGRGRFPLLKMRQNTSFSRSTDPESRWGLHPQPPLGLASP